jgi:hypothetical protein
VKPVPGSTSTWLACTPLVKANGYSQAMKWRVREGLSLFQRNDGRFETGNLENWEDLVMFQRISALFEGNSRNIARMMNHTGFDALHAGETPYLFGAAVRRCAFCRHTSECADWLDAAEPGAAPPRFCPNEAFFRASQLATAQAASAGSRA